MKGYSLEQLSDFGDFIRGEDLIEYFANNHTSSCFNSSLNNVRISPDSLHIHTILRKPNVGLMTFDKCQRPQLIQNHLELVLSSTVPVVDAVYLEHDSNGRYSAVLAVVFENGRAEFWKYWECKSGWLLLQTSDLCNSPRAKVISVCVNSKFIVWCEERPPSETLPASNATRGKFRYCVCTRTYEVVNGGVALGAVKIALHNNPPYTFTVSGENVYLLPDGKGDAPDNLYKLFFKLSAQQDTVTVWTACSGTLLRHDVLTSKESDFQKLISDCVGVLSIVNPPEIRAFCSAASGGLLLLLSSGWVCLLGSDGTLRQVYKLADNCLAGCGTCVSLKMYHDLLALTLGGSLYLIDVVCGQELAKIPMDREGILFVSSQEEEAPHMLSERGLFVVRQQGAKPGQKLLGCSESLHLGSVLVDGVFEEACRYYQQRSLSSAQLTVEKLKSGGMFQAPIALSSILKDYVNGQKSQELAQSDGSHGKLLSALEAELKSLVALEEVKMAMLVASEKDLIGYCETLVQDEVRRLLCSELDRESVLYLNVIFSTFPCESWLAAQKVLQLRCNGEGSLCSKAPAEVWKSVLNPVQAVGHTPLATYTPANVVLPVFELLCRSVLHFQPSWLPRFLELVQQQQAGRSYSMPEGPESLPLYRRALATLPKGGEQQDLEVELLLCSQRPHAVMQALRVLMERQEWQRVTLVAQKFSQQSPLLNKEIFTTLLCEVSQHRDLDPYLELLWALCPEDLSATSILSTVLKSMPPARPSAEPFQADGTQLTVGLLRPLLSRVLQRDTNPSHTYADILQSPSFPPPTPPRQARGLPRVATDPAVSHTGSKPRSNSEA